MAKIGVELLISSINLEWDKLWILFKTFLVIIIMKLKKNTSV